MSTEDELIAAYAIYKADLVRAKTIAKQEMTMRIAELTQESLTELSRQVHNAHSQGMTKAIINALLGVYSNAAQARPIWDAYTPEKKTDLRVRTTVDSGESTPNVTVVRNGDEFVVSLEHQEVTVVGAFLHQDDSGAEWVTWDEPGVAGNVALGDDYPVVYQAVFDFLKREEANENEVPHPRASS